jgi:hypothetical protein
MLELRRAKLAVSERRKNPLRRLTLRKIRANSNEICDQFSRRQVGLAYCLLPAGAGTFGGETFVGPVVPVPALGGAFTAPG